VADDNEASAAEHEHAAGPRAEGLLLRWAWAASLEPEGAGLPARPRRQKRETTLRRDAKRVIPVWCECDATQLNLGSEEVHNAYPVYPLVCDRPLLAPLVPPLFGGESRWIGGNKP
jgi:hypothetical protein